MTPTYIELMKLITDRYSCRNYDTIMVPSKADAVALIEAARFAPSAVNRQPWQFTVVTSDKGREAIISSYQREWIRTAPAFIIIWGNHDEAWHRPYDGKDHTDVDISIAAEHICLAATALGLGSCWVCNFDPEVIRRSFPEGKTLEPIVIIPFGYPAQDSIVPEKKRRDIDDIVKFR